MTTVKITQRNEKKIIILLISSATHDSYWSVLYRMTF